MLAQIEKSRTNVYLNKVKKEQAKAIFKEYGMGLSDAINIFLTQSVEARGIPFEIKLPKQPHTPNAKTIQVIEDARAGVNMIEVDFKEHIKEASKCITR